MYPFYDSLLDDCLKPLVRSNFINTSSGLTHYLDTGEKSLPTLLLVHGSNSCAPIVMSYAKRFVNTYRIIALDIPGEPGKSAFVRLSKKSNETVSWLKECILTLNLKNVTILGYSMGAYIALKTSASHPKLFKQVIVVAPAGIIHGSVTGLLFKGMYPLLLYRLFKNELWLKQLHNSLNLCFNQAYYDYFKWVVDCFKSDYSTTPLITQKELNDLTIPVIAIIATDDIIFNCKKLRAALEKKIPNLKIFVLNNQKHVIDPKDMTTVLNQVL